MLPPTPPNNPPPKTGAAGGGGLRSYSVNYFLSPTILSSALRFSAFIPGPIAPKAYLLLVSSSKSSYSIWCFEQKLLTC